MRRISRTAVGISATSSEGRDFNVWCGLLACVVTDCNDSEFPGSDCFLRCRGDIKCRRPYSVLVLFFVAIVMS